MEHSEQFVQYDHLFGGAVVFEFADNIILAMASFAADAETVRVVASNVTAFELDGAGVVEGAVSFQVEMVADVLSETSRLVRGSEGVEGKVL